MGTPRDPEVFDTVTLVSHDETAEGFGVVYVDDDIVVLQTMGGRTENFTRKRFEGLFTGETDMEGGGSDVR